MSVRSATRTDQRRLASRRPPDLRDLGYLGSAPRNVAAHLYGYRRKEGQAMTGAARGGLSCVVRRGDLRHRTQCGVRRFATTRFDDELLAAVDAAAAAAVPLAVVVPLPAADIPVVLGAAALVAEVVRTRSLDVTATVVSRRLSQRAAYDQLYIGRDRLGDVIPRARLTVDGRLETIGAARRGSRGRMVLTTDPVCATGTDGALVVDATGAEPDDLRAVLDRGRRLVYVTDNPFDTNLQVIRDAGGVVWAFDPAALGQLAAPSDVVHGDGIAALAASAELLRAAGSPERLVWAPGRDTDLDAALRMAWSAVGRLAGSTGVSASLAAGHALRWAWGTLTTFALSVTAPDRYDRHLPRGPYAAKLADAAGHARAVTRNMTGPARAAWAAAADAFADLHAAAAAAPKQPLVRPWLDSLASDGRRGLLVTRNRAAVAALTAALEESPDVSFGWSDLVRVVSVRDVVCGRVAGLPVDSMLVTCPVPRAYASLIAAPPAPQVLTLAAGTWEAARAARQAIGAVRELAALREATVTRASIRLRVPAARLAAAEVSGSEVAVWRDGTVTTAGHLPELPGGSPWEPFSLDLLAVITGGRHGDSDAAVVPPPARATVGGATASVAAIMVTFTGGQCLLAEPNDVLYRRRGDEARRVAAKALAPGDVVALVDAAARRDLFDSVVDVLSELPKYAPLGLLISFWQDRARAARDRGYTHREILALMRRGTDPTRITSEQTIGTWIRGDSQGPEDPEDVRRFADAVRDRELAHRAAAVGRALRTRRILHRAVGRWLSAQITGAQLRCDDALIDPELGVHVADLLETVSVHEVAAVGPRLVSAPAGAVGILLDPETALGVLAVGARGAGTGGSSPAGAVGARGELHHPSAPVDVAAVA